MPKYSGKIGFAKQSETSPGVWEDEIIERNYRGDILRNTYRWDTSDKLNDDLNITNSISIVADSFLLENAYAIRYVTMLGARWEGGSIDTSQPPRLILAVGGLYNGSTVEETGVPQDSM